MKFAFAAELPANTDAVAYPVAKDGLGMAVGRFPEAASSLISAGASASRFDGACGKIFETFVDEAGSARRVVLVGTSKGSDQDLERAGGSLAWRLLTSGVKSLAIDFRGSGLSDDNVATFLFGVRQRSWRIDIYRTRMREKDKATLTTVTAITDTGKRPQAADRHDGVYEGLALARELVSEPANIIYPESFVERCQHLRELGIEIDVLDQPAMEALGMGALLGVSLGSARPPRLLVMRWNGAGDSSSKPVVLVGKGVTFDTGGISLKAGPGMEDMKWDMGGAAAVTGCIKALATRKAKCHVVGVCGLVENMPDGKAQRPGDIVTTMSGQTVEVLNTDAEGRLVLADAICWAQKTYSPEIIVDLATLTGAIIISLGHEYGGMFANDDGLADQLRKAGEASGDRLWRMPMGKGYDRLIDSPIADMKNIGPRPAAGSITAAQFIGRFVDKDVKWAHLDIAGMVWSDKDTQGWAKGATGYGVKLLHRFIADNFEG